MVEGDGLVEGKVEPKPVKTASSSLFSSVKKNQKENEPEKEKEKVPPIGYEGQFRLHLHQPVADIQSTALILIREVVSYGKGLNGLAYRDVVEMLQAYSSTILQARVRCFQKRWKFVDL